ncbi:helix-turn-helix transcriptional regulator [Pseudomonas fluorescens]|uniref:Uncharacterized protein n=1 Tax=Pseudomonas fluorescens TaxID=294 RepID=A0A5E7RIL4_PSEFL|nr:helix-turn-helix transcriptional regulator [Pseudomonas fluorescens]VVN65351.1 hypothetical protein PS833_00054 [Pseudomonas fluorescens]VVP73137.1 hypothetical protein PS914_01446 [Pseudomonas fluorescens]
MNSLFSEIDMHQGLGRAIAHIGQQRFWKHLSLLLQKTISFYNAVSVFYPQNGTPQVLAEYCADPHGAASSMATYLNGVYLLDPFFHACRDGISSGIYRLDEVAFDAFRHSTYFLDYFVTLALEDEVQFILQLPGDGALSLSLGLRRSCSAEDSGRLAMLATWVLPLMQQHWQQHTRVSQPTAQGDLTVHLRDAFRGFGRGVLTEREMEITRLMLRGASSKTMAAHLKVSPDTIKAHRRNLYSKLAVSSQSELFSRFIQSLEQHGRVY